MSFLHLPVFMFGSLCVIAPVVIHLMMRRKPQELVFPALRFVKKRQTANKRSLRVRHFALLALRCLAVLAAAATFARPIIASAALGAWTLVGATALGFLIALGLGLSAWKRQLGGLISSSLFILAIGLLIGCLFLANKAMSNQDALPTVDFRGSCGCRITLRHIASHGADPRKPIAAGRSPRDGSLVTATTSS